MTGYPIALWSFNLGRAPVSVADLSSQIEEGLIRASRDGARLLVLPEYMIECCLAFKPAGLSPDREMQFLAETGQQLLEGLRSLPEKHGVSLLAGTMPVQTKAGLVNAATLLTADNREIRQDKLCLTPFEKDPATWLLTPGNEIQVLELDGLKVAILICLDVEMPALSCLLAEHNIDLLIVPSMTEMLSGYHRVFGCAKARAVELMCAVAVCGVVGASRGTTQNDSNVSGAALYVPCEQELGCSGIAGEIAPTTGDQGEEPYLIASVPVDSMRALRSGAAEVWPGAWRAGRVRVLEV